MDTIFCSRAQVGETVLLSLTHKQKNYMKLHEVQNEEDYRQMYKERGEVIRSRMAALKEKGEATGAPALGYQIIRMPDGAKRVVEDTAAMLLVREARELYSTGRYSVRELLHVMTEKGLRSRSGKLIGVSSMWNILKKS